MNTDPNDEFDRLARALRASAPQPDPAAKAAAIVRSMENFDTLAKELDDQMLPTQDRPSKWTGFLTGVRHMLSYLTSKQALGITTSAAALCLGLFVILPQEHARLRAPADELTAPAAEVARNETPQPNAALPLPTAQQAPALVPPVAPSPQPADIAQGKAIQPARRAATSELVGNAAPIASEESVSRLHADSADMVAIETVAPPAAQADTEAFANEAANPVKVTADEPVSTFSADVDTASYAVVRNSVMSGYLPPHDAVRVEEMVNYFPYDYPAPGPQDASPFKTSIDVMQTPWNPETKLVRIGLQGRQPAIADRPPLNLVFLIDTSGSMQDANKLPLLKQSLRLMLGQLRAEDQVAIVAYAGSAGEVLPSTPASDSGKILAALDRLDAGGSTNGAEGLELAYRIAEGMAAEGEVSRILLATDGDFNVGLADSDALKSYVARKRKAGTYLSVLGFGRGNLDDATMQSLAQNGNGQAAYIDTLQEAQKVLVDQLSGALFPIADDVKLQVEWNPAQVAEYRLIGYETRALRREDFNNDKVDAGEVGAGHSVTALYEVTPPDSPALLNNALRYQDAEQTTGSGDELGFLWIRYKAPGDARSQLAETPILGDAEAGDDARFAAAIAGFGQLLSGSTYLGDWGWNDAIALAQSGKGSDPFGYRAEAVSLMRLAQSLDAGRATGSPSEQDLPIAPR